MDADAHEVQNDGGFRWASDGEVAGDGLGGRNVVKVVRGAGALKEREEKEG